MKIDDILLKKKIIGASHVSLTGFTQHLEEYLLGKKTEELLMIEHPLHPVVNKSKSIFKLYRKGELIKKDSSNVSSPIEIFNYIKAPILTIWWSMLTKGCWDLYIGNNGLNTFTGLVLKWIGKVKKVVFYSVDFVPVRFKNRFMNSFYHWIDKISVIFSDEVWVLSPRMIEGRRKLLHIDKKYDKKQILFPEGVWLDRIKRNDFSKIQKQTAIFVGSLVERMGVQFAIKAIPYIIETIPNFKLIIIGKGPFEEDLKKLTLKLELNKHVIFKGFIENHKDVENLIATCALGLAIYTKDDSGLTYYADPSKTKLYLGAGIPIVMTDSFYNAYDIERAGAGLVVKDNEKEVARGIITILESEGKLKNYKNKAMEFAKQFDWPMLFSKNLGRVLS